MSPAERMRSLEIAQEGEPVLAEVARPFRLPAEAEDARRVVAQLIGTLERVSQVHNFSKGMGLAAPQIRIGRAAAVIRTVEGETVTLLNPRICDQSADTDEQYENCLSFFDVRGVGRRDAAGFPVAQVVRRVPRAVRRWQAAVPVRAVVIRPAARSTVVCSEAELMLMPASRATSLVVCSSASRRRMPGSGVSEHDGQGVAVPARDSRRNAPAGRVDQQDRLVWLVQHERHAGPMEGGQHDQATPAQADVAVVVRAEFPGACDEPAAGYQVDKRAADP